VKKTKQIRNQIIATFFLLVFLTVSAFQIAPSFMNHKMVDSTSPDNQKSYNAVCEDERINLDAFFEEDKDEKEGEYKLLSFFVSLFSSHLIYLDSAIIFPKLNPPHSFHGTSKFILALALRI